MNIKKISRILYILQDKKGCCANLVVGKKKALLFDTGIGIESMKEALRRITDLPLIVIASHGHYDHIGGSVEFEQVYMHSEDFLLLADYSDNLLSQWLNEVVNDSEGKICYHSNGWRQIKRLNFHEFDLGELLCQIVELPGHTKGSIGILIPTLKLLLSGDALTPTMCLFFKNHSSREQQYETLQKVEMMEFDYYLTSHHDKLFSRTMISNMKKCIENSYSGKFYEYQYPEPPYSKGWIYVDSIEDEPVGLILENRER